MQTEFGAQPQEQPTDLITTELSVGILLVLFLLVYYSAIALGRTLKALWKFLRVFGSFMATKWEEGKDDIRNEV